MPATDTRAFTHFGFAPLDNFSMIAFTNAIEVLRMAMYLGHEGEYRWSVLSIDGGEVTASNGRQIDFRVTAFDKTEEIGRGTHSRALIDLARFTHRLGAKAAGDTA